MIFYIALLFVHAPLPPPSHCTDGLSPAGSSILCISDNVGATILETHENHQNDRYESILHTISFLFILIGDIPCNVDSYLSLPNYFMVLIPSLALELWCCQEIRKLTEALGRIEESNSSAHRWRKGFDVSQVHIMYDTYIYIYIHTYT